MIPKQRVTSETKSAMSETCAVCSKRFAEKWTGCSYCEYKWWCTDGDCYTKKARRRARENMQELTMIARK
jgi:hypothetical protein